MRNRHLDRSSASGGGAASEGALSGERHSRPAARPRPRRPLAAALVLCGAATWGSAPARALAPTAPAGVEALGAPAELPIVRFDREALRSAAAREGRAQVHRLPLGDGRSVDLELEPFPVSLTATRFVLGRKGRPDQPLAFDPAQLAFFRGRVRGEAASSVFLALGPGTASGSIDLGGGERFRLGARDARGRALGPGEAALRRVAAAPGGHELPPGVALCGTDSALAAAPAAAASAAAPEAAAPVVAESGDALAAAGAAPALAAAAPAPTRGLRQLQLAVETDHEFWSLFGDSSAAAAYLAALYAEVSAIFVRDQQTRVELVFARLWDDPDDLFNDVDPSPLGAFRSYWNANMGALQRDAAQLLSGRRDYPFGGQAYLSALCGSSAYSVVGYALGFFPDPARPSPYHYDIEVTAHELGHNSGTGHTHDAPNYVDSCDDPATTPQRGTIMSYCSQTWSGGNSNQDLYFHTRIRQNMESHIASRSCVVLDCNVNGVRDANDIQAGSSADANGNGIPDECEDCNANGVLDGQDVATGASDDVDGNGVPDECQLDCNANGVPDPRDIALGASLDAHGNLVPDECEADCNANALSDYSEIQAAMSLDVDRNAVLDACQDCDADATSDQAELGGAHELWLASGLAGAPLRRFHAATGVRTRSSTGGSPGRAHDVLATPDGRVFVSSADGDRVAEFDAEGSDLGDLLAPGLGGLDEPAGLALTPDGRLLVASRGSASVLAYDLARGLFLGALVAPGAGGLSAPFGLALGPEGDLYVTSGGNEVLRYDARDGTYLGRFVGAASNGGLAQARGLSFKADGNLLVASYGSNETLEFDGRTGAPLGRWALSGNESGDRLNQVSPWGVRVGPNGNVFIVRTGEAFGSGGAGGHDHGDHGALHLTNAQVYEFDVRNGNFLRAHVNGNDHGHEFATGLAFLPGWELDCNLSRLPDACEIASGASADADASGVPDECELDCNGNGRQDRLDLIPFGSSLDCNANRVPDECDLAAGTAGACAVACNDGDDDDGDGFADFPSDPGCRGAADDSERQAGRPCDDGVDGDGDGFVDVPADPGCRDPLSPQEDPRCQNGSDDDGDGSIDFDGGASIHGGPIAAPDPQCGGLAHRNRERVATPCGLGFELAPALLLLARLRRRAARL